MKIYRFEDRLSNRVLNSMKERAKEQSSEQQKAILEAVESTVSRILDEKFANTNVLPGIVPSAGIQLGATSLLRQTSIASQQEHILKLLQQGDVNAAFQTVSN